MARNRGQFALAAVLFAESCSAFHSSNAMFKQFQTKSLRSCSLNSRFVDYFDVKFL